MVSNGNLRDTKSSGQVETFKNFFFSGLNFFKESKKTISNAAEFILKKYIPFTSNTF